VTPEKFEAFLAAKKRGLSTPDALSAIGEAPYAQTTVPFDTKRTADLANN
jgi:cytochrome c oxidase subunit 2